MVRGLPRGRLARAALCLPFAANALVVVLFLVVDLVAQLLNNVKSIFGLY